MTEDDRESKLPEEAGSELFDWMKTVHLEPEVARRINDGAMAEGDTIHMAQVVFWVGRPPEVRVNEEVQGLMQARATRAIEKDEEVTTADMSEISGFVLPEEDGDAAHLTMVSVAGGLALYFNGAYNALLIAAHVEAAGEFVDAATASLDADSLRAFVDGAFSATELLAKAEMLSVSEERLLGGVGHGTVRSFYNQWAALGNTEMRFAKLLNRLTDLRPTGRYLRGEFDLDAVEAARLLRDLKDLAAHVEATRPLRELGGRPPRLVTVAATREIRRGEVVAGGAFRIFK